MAKIEAEKQRLEMQNHQKQLELETQQQMLEAQNQQKQLEIEAQNQQKQVELEAQSRRIEAELQLEKARPANSPTPLNSSPVKPKIEKQQTGLSPSNNVVSKPAVGSVVSTTVLFRQQIADLEIQHITSSAYHPESQKALERFHQTLKCTLP
nr:uncharacterized protein LOC123749452 [Procambarus clarkii]